MLKKDNYDLDKGFALIHSRPINLFRTYGILSQSEMHRQSRHIGHNGFTLIEILIALVLLGISVAILAQLFSTNLRNIGSSHRYVPAVVMAEARMGELLANESLEESATTSQSEDGYSMNVSVSETMHERFRHLPVKLLKISLNVRWQMDRQEKIYTLLSYKTVKRSGFSKESDTKHDNKEEEQAREKK